MNLWPHTIIVLRATAGSDDVLGNPVLDWAHPAESPVVGCSVQPETGQENTLNRDLTVSRWRLRGPIAADITSNDRVSFKGAVYDIDGEVQRWADFGDLDHFEALLKRSEAA